MSLQNATTTPEIEVENLVIRYGPVAAVGPVSFAVKQGEQLTLLGPSGCGKTTTLRSTPDWSDRAAAPFASVARPSTTKREASTFPRSDVVCRWCSNRTRSGRT